MIRKRYRKVQNICISRYLQLHNCLNIMTKLHKHMNTLYYCNKSYEIKWDLVQN